MLRIQDADHPSDGPDTWVEQGRKLSLLKIVKKEYLVTKE
jgi:hypothetical protein